MPAFRARPALLFTSSPTKRDRRQGDKKEEVVVSAWKFQSRYKAKKIRKLPTHFLSEQVFQQHSKQLF